MNKLLLGTALVGALALHGLSTLPATAQTKDSLTIGFTLEPPHLDPTAGAAGAIDATVYANVFEGLTRIDENGAVQPQLAESWSVSKDGLVYTFNLKTGDVP
jgi:peptide/nickel transport system substrate-binding protein